MRFSQVVFVVLFSVVVTAQTINLSDFSWTLSNERGYNNVTTNGTVPGDSFTDLMAAGIIEDPYYRYNDMNYRWVSLDNWTYSTQMNLPSSVLSQSRVVLWFEGLDTVATVKVNGKTVGETDNMFRRWIFDIKDFLNQQTISLSIEFTSSSAYAKQKADETPYHIPESEYKTGLPHRNFIRTSQCHFAWDWGPCFLTQGVWQAATIEAFSDGRIQYVAPHITPTVPGNLSNWNVDVDVWILPANTEITATLQMDIMGYSSYLDDITLSGKEPMVFTLSVQISKLVATDLWWPRGYGGQTRHPLRVEFYSNSNSSQVQQTAPLVGFRTAEIIQEPMPRQVGLSFYIQVNNVPIFAKGANWIPADAFESRVTDEVLEELLESAYDANMNTIRNWGGGIYQHDRFYEICDEKGFLVWEEFMFACGMYPRDAAFLNTVKEEVKHQVLRLMQHPSIIIWSGNNENELALGSSTATAWYVETTINPYRYVVDYSYLNTDTVYDTIHTYDNTRPWLPSSPSNGILTLEPYVERWGNPASPHWGDVHYYNYLDVCTDVSIYPTPRFASEFGFQSYPTLRTMAEVSLPEDWDPHSPFMNHRQHHPDGNSELDRQISQHFHYPNSTNSEKKYSDWLYLTQCIQALCLRVESEHYRRLKSEEALTMGALYWQLNSIWQAPSWSSLEYGNKWKMVHYFTKEFFAETIISSYVSKLSEYIVYVTSDSMSSQTGSYSITAVSWQTNKNIKTWQGQFTVSPLGSSKVFSQDLNSMLLATGSNSSEIYFDLKWTADSSVVATNEFFLTPFTQVRLSPVTFNVTAAGQDGNVATLVVTCSTIAPYTFLETSVAGRFSDNGFICRPGTQYTIQFYGKSSFDMTTLTKTMTINALQDTYES